MRTTGIEFASKGEMRFKDIGDAPAPGPNQVLIETAYSGITNGTERHALMAEHVWGQFPSSHGYQHVGRIVAAGGSVKGFELGQWVFYGQYVGHRAWNLVDLEGHGGLDFQSHLVVELPHGCDRQESALLGVAGVALRGVRRFRIRAGETVWVVGQGLIGGFAAQAASVAGAHVTVSDVNPRRLSRAEAWGCEQVIDARDTLAARMALREGGPYNCIIDGSGAPGILDSIWEDGLLAYRGRIGLLAVRTDTHFHWPMLHGTEGSIEVSCHFSIDDLSTLIRLVQRGLIKIEPIISHRVSIDDAPEIYATLRDRPAELMGVVFDWS